MKYRVIQLGNDGHTFHHGLEFYCCLTMVARWSINGNSIVDYYLSWLRAMNDE
ncbi:MAG: hypothetical protein ACOCYF_01830 [Bacteroidota bacterium]